MISSLTHLSVGRRLTLGFASIVLMLVGVAAFNGLEFGRMGRELQQIVEVNNPKTEMAHRMLVAIDTLAIQARTVTLLTDTKEVASEAKLLATAEADYRKAEADLAKAIAADGNADEHKLLEDLVATSKKALVIVLKGGQAGAEGKNIEATMTLGEAKPLEAAWRKKVRELIALEQQLSQAGYNDVMAQRQRSTLIVGAVVLLAVLLGSVIGWRITRSVKRPIDQAINVSERIAEGDLSTAVDVKSHDEIGRLLLAVKAMQDRLRQLVSEISGAAQNIQNASQEVAAGNTDLSQRTELTAGNLQQTASAMQQLSSTVRQSADAAATANQLAASASSTATRGGEVVAQVVATMDDIAQSSKKIGDIIGVIDGIAFQTNILALNAAVEAARAGEQGRGFAVVAGEVRSLAQRSAEAAKQVKSLVGSSIDRVETGASLVQEAGSTMQEIVASVHRVSDIIGEIASAATEQSSGIRDVNTAVTDLDAVTQQNAALVEESAAAALSLREQSDRLAEMVATFRLA